MYTYYVHNEAVECALLSPVSRRGPQSKAKAISAFFSSLFSLLSVDMCLNLPPFKDEKDEREKERKPEAGA